MGWFNRPDMSWSELERRLSDGRPRAIPPGASGGDSPAWSRSRQPYEPPRAPRRAAVPTVPYAELHCHSNFSFLDGASHPEELAEEAARLGLCALALTDHDGVYGVVRFAEAAAAVGLRTVFGAELSLGLSQPQNGMADPEGAHLVVLARDPEGYARLCRAISEAQLAGREKGRPVYQLSRLAELHGGHWLVLTGCRKGFVPRVLADEGPAAAARALADLAAIFGRDNVAVELWDHGDPLDSARNDVLAELAAEAAIDIVATNNVHYATPARRRLATALAAVRARRSLDEIDGWLPPAPTAHLRSGEEQARRFARYPGVVERAAAIGRECAFDLRLVAPKLPDYPVPPGHDEMSWLRQLTMEGARRRYGPRPEEGVPEGGGPREGARGAPGEGASGRADPGARQAATRSVAANEAATDGARQAATRDMAAGEAATDDGTRRTDAPDDAANDGACRTGSGAPDGGRPRGGPRGRPGDGPRGRPREGPRGRPPTGAGATAGRPDGRDASWPTGPGLGDEASEGALGPDGRPQEEANERLQEGATEGPQEEANGRLQEGATEGPREGSNERPRDGASARLRDGASARLHDGARGRPREGARPEGAAAARPHDAATARLDATTAARAYMQLDHELDLIEHLGFAGYFLVVWDIVEFCRRSGIYCQGRGSAANSAVCYALGITNADAVALGLLFERFLSPERDGPPDIDLDIESDRREEAIQYVYERYGRENAAQVANVITYRAKSAIRDMAKALGHSTGQQDAWSKQVDAWGPLSATTAHADHDIPEAVIALAGEVQDFPRHLGIHSGGMVICDRPVVEVCPVEWGRMEGRTVLQWDKDDCAAVGLVKFDLLGLGMLTALHEAVDLIAGAYGVEVDLATIPQEDAVYEMLCRADSVGVFQVESRAQMATLPRLKPKRFYDLVVEVALIRPGPIQGGSVHPYIRRRNGQEPVTYLHPLLEGSLSKTLGVPLFQEQLMQMAIDVAGFTPAESDELRQAMGSKRSRGRMERLRERLYEGMAANGITGEVADAIFEKLVAFANYGFPESHSVSFAYLVYASAWIKHHYPAAFCAALLNAQPMGFWSPQSLVADARRHGVAVLGPDVNESAAKATLAGTGGDGTVRLGIEYVRTIGKDLAERIAAGRPYSSMEDVVRRCELTQPQVEALATAGAFASFGVGGAERRQALWSAGAVAQSRPGRLDGVVTGAEAPPLPSMTELEEAAADMWATGISPAFSPTQFARARLDAMGVLTTAALAWAEPGSRVLVGGVVTHRQRPSTAGGTVFVNLEDETGMVNVVCSKGLWTRYRRVARSAPALLVRGRLERAEGVVNVVADKLEALPLAVDGGRSRDFR